MKSNGGSGNGTAFSCSTTRDKPWWYLDAQKDRGRGTRDHSIALCGRDGRKCWNICRKVVAGIDSNQVAWSARQTRAKHDVGSPSLRFSHWLRLRYCLPPQQHNIKPHLLSERSAVFRHRVDCISYLSIDCVKLAGILWKSNPPPPPPPESPSPAIPQTHSHSIMSRTPEQPKLTPKFCFNQTALRGTATSPPNQL